MMKNIYKSEAIQHDTAPASKIVRKVERKKGYQPIMSWGPEPVMPATRDSIVDLWKHDPGVIDNAIQAELTRIAKKLGGMKLTHKP